MKLKLFYLSLIFASSSFSQETLDTLLKAKANKVLKDCWEKGRYTWLDTNYYACLDSAIKVYPYWYFYHLKAMPSIKTGDYDCFVKSTEQACVKNPKWNDYFGYISLYNLKDYELALSRLRLFDALTPNSVDIVMNDNILSLYGLCYSEMGKYDTALIYFDSLIEIGSDGKNKFFPTLYDYTNRGVVHLKMKNYEKAKKDFQSTIRNYSKSVEGNYYLAFAMFNLGEDVMEIEPLLKIALTSYDNGLRNNHPYGEYVDLPNAVWRSDIMDLYYKIKSVKW